MMRINTKERQPCVSVMCKHEVQVHDARDLYVVQQEIDKLHGLFFER
jgi:hypothetical protein